MLFRSSGWLSNDVFGFDWEVAAVDDEVEEALLVLDIGVFEIVGSDEIGSALDAVSEEEGVKITIRDDGHQNVFITLIDIGLKFDLLVGFEV